MLLVGCWQSWVPSWGSDSFCQPSPCLVLLGGSNTHSQPHLLPTLPWLQQQNKGRGFHLNEGAGSKLQAH